MNVILICLLFFFLTLAYSDFKKSFLLKNFNTIVKGIISDIKNSDEGVFFEVEYYENNNKKIYFHPVNQKKIEPETLNALVMKFIEKPFYLWAKKENESIVEVVPYSKANITKWIYLVIALLMGYFLFLSV